MRGGLRGKSFLPVSELEDHGNGRGRAEVHITHRSVTAPGNHHPCLSLCLSRTTGPTQESRGSRANLVSFYLHTADPKSYLPAKYTSFVSPGDSPALGAVRSQAATVTVAHWQVPSPSQSRCPHSPPRRARLCASPIMIVRRRAAGPRPGRALITGTGTGRLNLNLNLKTCLPNIKREHARREGTRP